MIPLKCLHEAVERISPYIQKTPLTFDADNELYIKWENRQITGSFKVRGAFNKVLSLGEEARASGIVTASAGNHGQAVALAGRMRDIPVTVFASEHAVAAKVEAMRSLGAEVRLVPGGYGEAEQAGLKFSRDQGSAWVSPYNDRLVIAGQGTLGLEISQDLPPIPGAVWIIPAGGGGLVAGIGLALEASYGTGRDHRTRPQLVAVQSEASPFLHALYQHGSQEEVTELPSLADGLAGQVEPGAMTIDLVRKYVDDFILVSEEEIGRAIGQAWQGYHERIEGSAAAALAALIFGKVSRRPAVVVITGGNIQPEVHSKIVSSAS